MIEVGTELLAIKDIFIESTQYITKGKIYRVTEVDCICEDFEITNDTGTPHWFDIQSYYNKPDYTEWFIIKPKYKVRRVK